MKNVQRDKATTTKTTIISTRLSGKYSPGLLLGYKLLKPTKKFLWNMLMKKMLRKTSLTPSSLMMTGTCLFKT